MARRYLTYTYIGILVVSDHDIALPNPQLLTAHEEHISCLSFERCNFTIGEGNALDKTLFGCRIGQLFIETSKLPGAFNLVTFGLLETHEITLSFFAANPEGHPMNLVPPGSHASNV